MLPKFVYAVNYGNSRFEEMWKIQKQLHLARQQKRNPDILIFTEHEHVYTFGKSSNQNHLLANEDELNKKGIETFEIDRGGDITYHGPGQIVCYPIINLSDYSEDIHKYLRNLEEVIIRTLSSLNIKSTRNSDYTGVWFENEKIAAIGVKVSRWITMHGFAFNNFPDLTFFDRIIPCGIFHKGVTSLKQFGIEIPNLELINLFKKYFTEVFNMEIVPISKEELIKILGSSILETESELIKN